MAFCDLQIYLTINKISEEMIKKLKYINYNLMVLSVSTILSTQQVKYTRNVMIDRLKTNLYRIPYN